MSISQCINCESVYETNESNSSVPTSCCSKECEDNYKKYIKKLELIDHNTK
jgi:hypothetical protein